jgi:geranylgeranyl transferase type-2 subunit beta
MPTYLEQLTLRLTSGLAVCDEAWRERHAQWILARQTSDGGFPGRGGESDLYYTSFALRSLAILGGLYGDVAQRAADFLARRLSARETIIDFLSLIYSAAILDAAAGIDVFSSASAGWKSSLVNWLETLRRPDGGYAKGPEGQASSTYHSFLVLLCLELMEADVARPDALVQFLHAQRADEGGFREIRAAKRAGTNPTAAAIGALRLLGRLDDETRQETIEFLAEMQTDEGGLRANTRIPIADLLSTFTGLLTLTDLHGRDVVDLRALRRFADSLEDPRGGYLGGAWDQGCDVEYTFYGLGVRGLLAAP